MNNNLQGYLNNLKTEVSQIPGERKEKLSELSESVRKRLNNDKLAKLTFICTHNSRRSHLCQIWAATMADHWGLGGIETYSGGTEATAFNPRAVEAIRRAGFTVENPGGDNPHYKVFYDEGEEPLVCYSKTFDDAANPNQDFVAVMTCSDADQNCPVVPGAAFRITITYEDPKQADGTPQEEQVYDERCRQIAAEMYYMLSRLN
ncbi:protein-tyrosine-phosphatase [Aliifodinibius sp. S!AR15-10]|uniref:protein-tyrosine-phosphatase n=1 Tax=Aliifodinibius sp. S!AR15-10 TaxID=2950437 RepID=UPI00285F414C|nr:protein-tyrosine-phosphatase [Aliifodinibius sp. S!AR15-10]MDR8393770.1 protein-tyrosine-phosphatase [Aliifodinibius sp. S!AR15-10]